jgi:hypothetical protein
VGEYGSGTFYVTMNMTLKPIKVILRRGRGKRENNGGDEPNWGTLYIYMEMSQ